MKQKASPLDQAIERFVVDFAAIIQGQVELAVERAFDLQGVARSAGGRRGRKPRAEREPADVDTETSATAAIESEAADQSAELAESDQVSPADLSEAREAKQASPKRGRGAKQSAKRGSTVKQKAPVPEAPRRGRKAKQAEAVEEQAAAPKRGGKAKKQSAEAPAKSRKGKAGRKRAEQLTLF